MSTTNPTATEGAEAKAKVFLKITVESDTDLECPSEWDGWKLYSFSSKHTSNRDVKEVVVDFGSSPSEIEFAEGVAEKMKNGLAHWLSYYEHGNCVWGLQGEVPSCQFDSVKYAGLLVWKGEEDDIGAKTVEDRQKDARGFLSTYTDWANGNGYWFKIEKLEPTAEEIEDDELKDLEGDEIDATGGFYGTDHLASGLRDALGPYMEKHGLTKDDVQLVFAGELSNAVSESDLLK